MTINFNELSSCDFSEVVSDERIPPVTPGEVLREEFMEPLGMSARALARDLGVAPNRITEILNGERSISAQTALLLAQRFGTSAEFWMNLQSMHDLELAREAMAVA
jgi:addiction module HigA family antidote